MPLPGSYIRGQSGHLVDHQEIAVELAAAATLSNTAPPSAGVGAPGSAAQASRDNHVHPAGYAGINAQTGTTYTVALSDQGRLVTLSNAAKIAAKLPTDAAVAFPVLGWVDFLWLGVGQPQVSAVSSGTTTVQSPSYLSSTPKLRAAGSIVRATKIGANSWVVSGDVAAVAPTVPPLPTISGMLFHLDASGTLWQNSGRTTPATADGDPVGAWDDTAPTPNHALQATSADRPTLKTGANGLNGLPVVRFAGAHGLGSALVADANVITWFIVLRPNALTPGSPPVITASAAGFALLLHANGTQEVQRQLVTTVGTSTSGVVIGAASQIEFTYNGSAWAFYLDRVANGSGSTTATFANSTTVIGRGFGASPDQWLTGDIAEILKYDSVLSTPNRQGVEAYLAAKWDLP